MTITFRPAIRENTPLIIGIAGPTKSGKTFSAHRLARGLAADREIVMMNAEGARGHQYADTFTYTACDLVPPYRYGMYEDVLRAAAERKPGAIIIDSVSHAHDGPGGFLEWHEEELDRMFGTDFARRDKGNFTAWIKPKAAENSFRYAMLEVPCPIILCMRAKDKLRIVTGKPPVDLGLQPIIGEGLSYETIFTLTLPAHSRGVPDLDISDLREPFDAMVPKGEPINEELGRRLAKWASGGAVRDDTHASSRGVVPSGAGASAESGSAPALSASPERASLLAKIAEGARTIGLTRGDYRRIWIQHCAAATEETASPDSLRAVLRTINQRADTGGA